MLSVQCSGCTVSRDDVVDAVFVGEEWVRANRLYAKESQTTWLQLIVCAKRGRIKSLSDDAARDGLTMKTRSPGWSVSVVCTRQSQSYL